MAFEISRLQTSIRSLGGDPSPAMVPPRHLLLTFRPIDDEEAGCLPTDSKSTRDRKKKAAYNERAKQRAAEREAATEVTMDNLKSLLRELQQDVGACAR